MKIGKGRDGHDDDFGEVLEVMGWWLRRGSRYEPFPRCVSWIVRGWLWRLLPEGRRYVVRHEPKPFNEREAYARLKFPDATIAELGIENIAGAEVLEPLDIYFWTRWGAERFQQDAPFSDRHSWFGDPQVVKL